MTNRQKEGRRRGGHSSVRGRVRLWAAIYSNFRGEGEANDAEYTFALCAQLHHSHNRSSCEFQQVIVMIVTLSYACSLALAETDWMRW